MERLAKVWDWTDGTERILLVTCPKTGNAWVKSLLSHTYRIPQHDFSQNAEDLPNVIENMTAGVGNIHPWPSLSCYEKASKRGVKLLTIIRHPIRVFLSLFHQTRNKPNEAVYPETLMLEDGGQLGKGCEEYLRDHFPLRLMISHGWQRLGVYCVRYEDLHRNVTEELTALTNYIKPVSTERIYSAAQLSNFDMMFKLAVESEKSHFRKGQANISADELPENILRVFRDCDPYPLLFDALGYSLSQPQVTPQATMPTNPFDGRQTFPNGAYIPPVVIRCWVELTSEYKTRWQDPVGHSGPGSFFNWLNAYNGNGSAKVTNLALFIYLIRPDVREAFPDLFGYDWLGFCQWFLSQARIEYGLDHFYLRPIFEAVVQSGQPYPIGDDI